MDTLPLIILMVLAAAIIGWRIIKSAKPKTLGERIYDLLIDEYVHDDDVDWTAAATQLVQDFNLTYEQAWECIYNIENPGFFTTTLWLNSDTSLSSMEDPSTEE